MQSNTCLNCNSQVTESFCASCGQKTSTHRFSLKHFFTHDLLHGWLHLDKGFLFTTKELFTRPGHSIREYIQGKRVKHFHFISYIIILITVSVFFSQFIPFAHTELVPTTNYNTQESTKLFEYFTKDYNELYTKYQKLFYISYIPIYAFFSYLLFLNSKLNYAENLVLQTYKTATAILLGALFYMLAILYNNLEVLRSIFTLLGFVIYAYGIWFYYQFFSVYEKSKILLLIKAVIVEFISIFTFAFLIWIYIIIKHIVLK